MGFLRRSVGLLSLLVVLSVAGLVIADEPAEQQPPMTPEMQAEMEMWMKLAQPGEHHQHLAAFVGTWQGKVKMWMTPDSEPMADDAVAEVKLILGGRFLEWTNSGNFQSMPFEGRAIEGYNNGDKRYESMWIDNFGTLIVNFTGSCSEDGKSREMATQFSDPMKGGMIDYRSVYTWTDADHFTYTSYMKKDGKEFKNMEISYSRQ